eukprot:CAMPEP_0114991430 /NCGR_PEP_ID=MMETSP0216-20121206/11367_1 /TAXON_ID=223996 /ORGANISM="Protocruzia adherens, Strain Boccale" /LENGTH=80 /DNA_ID=CAMNT_0002354755 /DNA_START=451 /DNA_END=693 /DNA_ORIENTATION=+
MKKLQWLIEKENKLISTSECEWFSSTYGRCLELEFPKSRTPRTSISRASPESDLLRRRQVDNKKLKRYNTDIDPSAKDEE